MELLYQEWLRTRPWDIILAIVVITSAAGVPTAVAIGTWIQRRRTQAERKLPWSGAEHTAHDDAPSAREQPPRR